jgi:hypothetical protein
MPIPNHITFAATAIARGDTAYSPQMSKSLECDRLINIIYDDSLTTTSQATIDNRYTALLDYLTVKGQMAMFEYYALSGARRIEMRNLTLTNTLYSNGDGQIGRAGRFHRALTSVYNETVVTATIKGVDKGQCYFEWCNTTIQGIAAALGESAPPTFIAPIE